MLFWVVLAKLVIEIALLALLGRWVLQAWLRKLAPASADRNIFLWLFQVLCRPLERAVGWITPPQVPRHAVPVVALALLAGLWLAATLAKIALCAPPAGTQWQACQ